MPTGRDPRDRLRDHRTPIGGRPLVDFLVIGAMKCGTTSLHHYLSAHPQLGLAPGKEVNFFFGTGPCGAGNFWRGTSWYADLFPTGARVRGEVSPGYTSPDQPCVAERVARLAPDVKLVYLVRDPLDRAVSQYQHHLRDGTEHRPLDQALLDPRSHYVRRSRYADRLRPFLSRFPAPHIAIVDHSDLQNHTSAVVASLCRFLGVDPDLRADVFDRRLNLAGSPRPEVNDAVADRFRLMVADDVEAFARIREHMTQLSMV